MKTGRVAVRIIVAVAGPLITAILGGVHYLGERWPLSMLEWIAVLAITLSILYGLGELAHFLVGLHRRIKAVQGWLGIEPPTIHYETFGEWLRHQSPHGFQHMARASLDERMVTMLEWWASTPTEGDRRVRMIVQDELAKARARSS